MNVAIFCDTFLRNVVAHRTTQCCILEGGNMKEHIRFEVCTAVTMKNAVFCLVTPCGFASHFKTVIFIITAMKTLNLT
jgi:hypothetical protein